MKSKLCVSIILVVLFFVVSSGCTSKEGSNQTATAQPTLSSNVTLSPTVGPTANPSATLAPEPVPISLVGTGKNTTQPFSLEQGLSLFSMKHTGPSNFTVWLMDSNGRKIDLLVSVIGEFQGSKAEGLPAAGNYTLDIATEGDWSVDITQPRPTTAQGTPVAFTGTGQHATRFFTLKTGQATFRMAYNGTSNFIVWLDDVNGNHVDLLANAMGQFNSSKTSGIANGGIYLLDVSTIGTWEIDVSQT